MGFPDVRDKQEEKVRVDVNKFAVYLEQDASSEAACLSRSVMWSRSLLFALVLTTTTTLASSRPKYDYKQTTRSQILARQQAKKLRQRAGPLRARASATPYPKCSDPLGSNEAYARYPHYDLTGNGADVSRHRSRAD